MDKQEAASIINQADPWRLYPHTYAQKVSDEEWNPYWYLKQTSKEMKQMIEEGGGRLIVTMPPRHGKTTLIGKMLPLWYLEHNPANNVMFIQYSSDKAKDVGRFVRDKIDKDDDVLCGLGNKQSTGHFVTEEEGNFFASGISSGITGRGGDLIIIDDPIADYEQAQSPRQREKVINAFEGSVYTRMSPDATIILLMTRWHSKDLAGYLVDEHSDDWTYRRYPAIKDEVPDTGPKSYRHNPKDTRDEGEALCPERFDAEEMNKRIKATGQKKGKALFQAKPPDENRSNSLWSESMIEENREPDIDMDDIVRIVVAVDPSGGGADEIGIVVAGRDADSNGYVLEDASGHYTPDEWARKTVDLYHKYQADRIVGEVNFGGNLVESNIRSQDGSVSYREVRASKGKTIRAEPVVSFYERGKVAHVGEFGILEQQMTTYDPDERESPDRMDALVWALTELLIDHGGTWIY